MFASSNVLGMLSKSDGHYADGAFNCASVCFSQLYDITAYFSHNKYGQNIDNVWVYRVIIQCALEFSKKEEGQTTKWSCSKQ